MPTGEPETVLRESDAANASTKLSRLGSPVSGSCRTRWRSASSAAWRSIASARTLAEAWTKCTSWGVKRLGSDECTSRMPKGRCLPSIGTARLLRTPIARRGEGIEKRLSADQSSTITCRRESSAAPAWESRAAEARPAPTARSSRPVRRLSRRPSSPTSQMQAAATPSISVIRETASPHQRFGVAVPQRPPTEAGHRGLLCGGALQVLLGGLALGDVVEDAVPDRRAGFIGLEDRLVEDPDGATVAGEHPVVDRWRVAIADRPARLLRQRPLAVLGMQQLRPELGVRQPLLRRVAEDVLDLGADVAPATVLAQLRRVDDRGKALDQATVVFAPG